MDGIAKLADHEETYRPKPRYVFIFDKMILICKALKVIVFIRRSSLMPLKFLFIVG